MPSPWAALAALQYQATQRATFATPADVARVVDGHRSLDTPMLRAVNAALMRTVSKRGGRLIITTPPQEGKTTRGARDFPLWCWTQNPEQAVTIVSYDADRAADIGRSLRSAITNHGEELGLELSPDRFAANSFTLHRTRRGAMRARGVGGGIVGFPSDVMIVDDPHKDLESAMSAAEQRRVGHWFSGSVMTRLTPHTPVILIATRWCDKDLIGQILDGPTADEWEVLKIPAQATHDPAKGETDPLGREPGEWLESVQLRTPADWERKRREVGTLTWQAQYLGDPKPVEGTMFKRAWIREYASPLWTIEPDGRHVAFGFDEVIISADLTFKDEASSDFVALGVFGRKGAHVFVLDMVRKQMDFPTTVSAFKALAHKWPQALLKLVEDTANGPALISLLAGSVPGIVPVTPRGSKEARGRAWSPIVEAGNFHVPNPTFAPWVDDYVAELTGFPFAANDDQVDATSQAVDRLVIRPLLPTSDMASFGAEDFGDYEIVPSYH